MKVIFCKPELTIGKNSDAIVFFESCCEILDTYVTNKIYISSAFQVDQLLAGNADASDILVFFNSEDGKYQDKFLKLLNKYTPI